jgi:hypothetical protein
METLFTFWCTNTFTGGLVTPLAEAVISATPTGPAVQFTNEESQRPPHAKPADVIPTIFGLLEENVNTGDTGFLLLSRAVALNCKVSPKFREALDGLTVMDATATNGVPLLPPPQPLIITATAVTRRMLAM